MASRAEIDEVRSRIDILDVVSRYVNVKPSGKNFACICPFHQDSAPSMTISPEKGFFHCFGCGENGDVFSFLMKIERLEFPEVLRKLATEAGVTLSKEGGSSDQHNNLRELANRVAKYYEKSLADSGGEKALKYLLDRGLTEDIICKFRIGFAPQTGDHLIRSFGSFQEDLKKLGLLNENEKGRWSFFRGRVMFPLFSTQGDVLGYAGRTLDNEEPKYINSRATELFEKSKLLYGIHLCREGFTKSGYALLVEGYTDVMMAHQHGFDNAIASMGTAFTADQARLLKRFVSRVLIAYDRDNSGQAATLRGLKQLLAGGLEVEIVQLPPGEDPDGLLRTSGAETFATFLENALPFPEFYVQRLFTQHDTNSLSGKEALLAEAHEFCAELSSPVLRDLILKKVSGGLMIPLEDLQLRMKAGKRDAIITSNDSGKPGWEVYEHLMFLLLQGEVGIDQIRQEASPDDFGRFASAVETLLTLSEQQNILSFEGDSGRTLMASWLESLEEDVQREIRGLALSESRDGTGEQATQQLLAQLRLKNLDQRLLDIRSEIQKAGSEQDESIIHLQKEYENCRRERGMLLKELGWGSMIVKRGGNTGHG
jgi:DNA primase